MAKTRFDKLSRGIQQREGLSKKHADAITAVVGVRKYGKRKMTQMAQKGKKC